MSKKKQPRIGLIGAGKMATALAKGLGEEFTRPENIIASDPESGARQHFEKETGVRTTDSNLEVVKQSEILILAIKPQLMVKVLQEIQSAIEAKHLVISIAAGIPLKVLETQLGADKRLVRVMPNTPCLVKQGASAFALGSGCKPEDAALVQQLLSTVGLALQVGEGYLDAVTGLSGSGPAYVFQIIEALSDGGVRVGLPRHIATALAAQTLLGAAQMVLSSGEHPGSLKDAVTSPGGTTIAGLHALEQGGLRGTLMNAVVAATERSRELGKAN